MFSAVKSEKHRKDQGNYFQQMMDALLNDQCAGDLRTVAI
jgi:hypothetical protein